MKILENTNPSSKKVTLVCCLHGEEEFSFHVFKYFEEHLNNFPGLKLILANEPALDKNERYLDQDLNRAFPGSEDGNREERLALEIMKNISQEDYLLDVHTTVSDTEMVPILTSMNEKTKSIVNALDPDRAVVVQPPLADKSLIGQIDHGVSLEVNYQLAKRPRVLQQVIDLVENLANDVHHESREREVFYVTGTIPKTVTMPSDAANFKFIPELQIYPFLYHPQSYKEIHCLKATSLDKVVI